MELTLKSLELINFQGIENRKIVFNKDITKICGKNGSGKSSIVDAFYWLLFNKNAIGQTSFEIKTYDENNEIIPKIDHAVIGEFEIDGEKITLEKNYKEEWKRVRGSSEETLKGHITEYTINNSPVSAKEYNEYISELFEENKINAITNPEFFGTLIHWSDARNLLLELVGDVDEKIFKDFPEFLEINNIRSKTIPDLKSEINMAIKREQENKTSITKVIVEKRKEIEEFNSYDFEQIEKDIDALVYMKEENKKELSKRPIYDKEIEKIQSKILSKKDEINNKNEEISKDYKDEYNKYFKHKISLEADKSNIENKKMLYLSEVDKKKNKTEKIKAYIKDLKEESQTILSKLKEEESKQFNPNEIKKCPYCGNLLSSKESFEINKHKILQDIKNKVNNLKKEYEQNIEEYKNSEEELKALKINNLEYEKELEKLNSEIELINKKMEKLEKPQFLPEPDISKENAEIEKINKKIKALYELEEQQDNLNSKITENKIKLAEKDKKEKAIKRVEELLLEEKENLQKIVSFEKEIDMLKDFEYKRAEYIEKEINSKVDNLQFRLFKRQVNGTLKETCDILVHGVPYAAASTGEKISRGVALTSLLRKVYNISAPLFIDNSESVDDFEVPKDCQTIFLKRIDTDDKIELNKNKDAIILQ